MRNVTLILDDGSRFHGKSFGFEKPVAGEVVFNTAMTGYPESLTDPSYAGQLMTLTYPLVGNYGVPPFTLEPDGLATFMESEHIHAEAIIVSDYSENYSHWNAVESLGDWLKREQIPGITGIDTRELTKVLREHGVMMGRIAFDDESDEMPEASYADVNYVDKVSCKEAIVAFFGRKISVEWEREDKNLISRRILITKPSINGKKFSDLRLRTKYGITITRVNRAGMDLIPYQGLELQVGDRVMVVGPAKSVAQVADVLGNSLKKLDHPNLITIFVGIALGVLLGSIPLLNVPQPVKLGLAGGPLIVAILIGRFGTHFHLVTYTTMSANLMLREIGIALFLAAVGIGAGDGFIEAIADGGYRWIGYGFIITVVPLLIVAIVARKWLRMNYYTLMGLIAGSTTDPPALAYANATAGNDMPAVGYSTVYPVVMFLRVLTAQIFILFAL